MIERKSITVSEGGVRLDAALLIAFPSSTRAFVREAIAAGDVLVAPAGGATQRAAKGLKLRAGDRIEVTRLAEADDNRIAPNPAIRPHVVFEDADLIAVDNPAGIPVQPLSCRETSTLMNGVVARYPECAATGDTPLMGGALHRIDADTSGLVLVARTAEAFSALRAQFAAQTVEKTYLALVEGSFAVGGTLENDLVHDPTLPFCRMVEWRTARFRSDERFRTHPPRLFHAVTRFEPIAHTTVENEERTLLKVTIFTGVTHQIRAQLAAAGLHIVNDRLYGAFAVENQVGHCLHALAAKFKHPVSGDDMQIVTRYPSWAEGEM